MASFTLGGTFDPAVHNFIRCDKVRNIKSVDVCVADTQWTCSKALFKSRYYTFNTTTMRDIRVFNLGSWGWYFLITKGGIIHLHRCNYFCVSISPSFEGWGPAIVATETISCVNDILCAFCC